MSLRLRHLIMWILLLALPVKGLTMVTMLHCGSGHQVMHQTSGEALKHVEGDHHAGHGHGHHGAVEHEVADLTDSGKAPDGHASSQCSACAACCLGAVLPMSATVLGVIPSVGAPLIAVGTHALAFLTNGPDRPPRHSLV